MSDQPVRGWCEREVERELPGLGLMCATLELPSSGRLGAGSPPAVLARLREQSNRWRGARAVNVRQEAIPAAYRVFFRQIGLDPDIDRTPIETAVLERMLDGGFLSEGLLADILTIALIDTAVPVWALDADTVSGPLGIRVSRAEERLGRSREGPSLGGGRLVVADADSPLAILFGVLAPEHEPTAETRRLALFAVQVAGVPALHAEETLWACCSALAEASR
ncbi:MAG TPA: phenylalanine--tRNA ligase beta subunit-related protein [Solirubrobacteraceae bacterium]|jgi:DNA/RNA-binding domain of Phe-tRNA-synthetase-like protein|nr:phenylalanine--tRNA ligase beta subunit-related protein [Solirubrobacteraceae bacterium]